MKEKRSIIIVDDDLAIMQCVGDFLARHEGIEVVGYASHAAMGVALALEKLPDLALLDIHMPGADAFGACRQIVDRTQDRVKVLFYSGFPREQYLERSIAAGAYGMVSKHSETIQGLALAIRYVLAGNTYFSPELAKRLLELENAAPRTRVSTLTPREIEVVQQLATGKTNSEIALELGVSLRSVEKEIADVKSKLDLKSVNELLMFAANEGIVYPELVLSPSPA